MNKSTTSLHDVQRSTTVEEIERPLPSSIGIWELHSQNGNTFYQRSTDRTLPLHHWSVSKKFPAKSKHFRTAFLGESAARGYLYDPGFNPAGVLTQMLNTDKTEKEYEVIDLARTNCELAELEDLSIKSLQLDADALVIFAGNNWIVDIRKSTEKEDYVQILAEQDSGGMECVQQWFSDKAYELIKSFFQNISLAKGDRNIPVIMVIPEFNLLDWKSSKEEQILAFCKPDDRKAFELASIEHKKALEKKDIVQAKGHAKLMIQIDPTNPLGYENMAECFLIEENYDEARSYLYKAIDTTIYYRTVSKPRCYSFIRKHILELAPQYGIDIVDLPEVFDKYLHGKLPGGDLFIDYCHLTFRGILVAMSAIRNKLNAAIGGELPIEMDIDESMIPDNELIGFAHFMAAVHNAHYGQPYERLLQLCQEAVDHSTEVKKLMRNYADFGTRTLPNNLCQSYRDIFSMDHVQIYEGGAGLAGNPRADIMDISLIDAIVATLENENSGLKEEIALLRQKEHGIGERKLDLLQSYYCSDNYYPSNGKQSHIFSARSAKSEFQFYADNSKTMHLTLVYRCPSMSPGDDQVVLYCNDKKIDGYCAEKNWQTVKVEISAEHMRTGLNRLSIVWPNAESQTISDKATTTEDYKNEWFEQNFPVLGQLHLFTATQLAQ